MTLHSGLHVPGAFFDGALGANDIHSDIFRPPLRSPLSSSDRLPPGARLQQSSHAFGESIPTRKRPRGDISSSQTEHSTPRRDPFETANDHHDTLSTPSAGSAPNTRSYKLAGLLDTPFGGPAGTENGILGESMYSDSDYRRALGSKRQRDDVDAPSSEPTPLFRLPAQPPPPSKGWGSAAVTSIGGVFGRVWQFCSGGAFKGFQAGGGAGYEVEQPIGVGEKESAAHRSLRGIPGRFPPADFYHGHDDTEEAVTHSRPSTSSRPGAKRRQTGEADDLGRNWVIVNEPQHISGDGDSPRSPSQHSLPRNRNHAPSKATRRRISTPTSRLSTPHHSLPRSSNLTFQNSPAAYPPVPAAYQPVQASSASFAHSRSPSPTKIPRASPSARPSLHRRGTSVQQASPRQSQSPARPSHRRTHSSASIASPRAAAAAAGTGIVAGAVATGSGAAAPVEQSPRLDAEARQLAARRRREERDADVRIATFNKQLQDMIRQGKEALGTSIEVDGGEGGWEYDE